MNKENLECLAYVPYAEGTYAYYDEETDAYYNESGTHLRDPNEYDHYSEGYTPFGDE